MKKIAAAVATASTLGFAGLTQAEAFDTAVGQLDVSMTATLATDYIWRGQSQTAGAGAVQGSLDVAHETGLYIGAWASNVDADAFDGASVEIDYYLGVANDLTENISYDIGWATYTYPRGVDSTEEFLASIGLYGFTIGTKLAYDAGDALYTYIGYGLELPYNIGLGLHFGRTNTKDSELGGDEKYHDWAVTLGKTVLGVDVALMYSDTNLSSATCTDWYGKSEYCSNNLTLSFSKTL